MPPVKISRAEATESETEGEARQVSRASYYGGLDEAIPATRNDVVCSPDGCSH